MSRLQHRLHAVVYPATDVPGQWVSHCLDLDIVSQGTSAEHAFEMLVEAVQLSIQWAIEQGRPPLELHPAPAEEWERYNKIRPSVVRILRIPSFQPEVVIEPAISSAG